MKWNLTLDVDAYETPNGSRISGEAFRCLIARATERHCPDCQRKIDRVQAPVGVVGAPDGAVMDGRGWWPVWRHHGTECPSRITAELMALP